MESWSGANYRAAVLAGYECMSAGGASVAGERGICVEQDLAGMSTAEWLAVEAGDVPDPAQLKAMAAALGMNPKQMGTVVQMCRGAWEQ